MTKREPATNSWPPTAAPVGRETVVLAAPLAGADEPGRDLSAAALHGDTLFLGGDEGVSLERLRREGSRWTGHERLALSDFLALRSAEEADVEGLCVDDDWLWVLGSHARTRPKLAKGGRDRIDLGRFAALQPIGPRCLLARIPLVPALEASDGVVLAREHGGRRAGMLRQTGRGNRLARLLAAEPLLRPFTRIAAKEGGVDLEGLAVAGRRVAVGMRGPVIQTAAVLIEFAVDAKRSGRLKIAGPLRMRLLDLDGLGIRDLKLLGSDLLILAGPTTGLDGPCAIHRWRNWLGDPPQDETVIRLHRPERVLDLPFGRGDDHPEGLFLLDGPNGATDVVVVCDGPAAARIDAEKRSIGFDRFRLPA